MTAKDARAIYRQCAGDYLRVVDTDVPPAVRRRLLAGALSALGVMRISAPEKDLSGEVDRLSKAVSRAELESVLTNAAISTLEKRLQDFVQLSQQNGDDVTLIEPDEEETLAAEEGRRLLMDRDDIECLLDGVQVLVAGRRSLRPAIKEPLEKLREQLRRLDKRWKPKVRHFVPFNAFRKAFRRARPEAERFWWWHLQSDCDLQAVYQAVEGEEVPVHITSCDACGVQLRERKAVVAALRSVHGLPRTHPDADLLVRAFNGEASGEEEEWVEWHVHTCESCRADMEALQRADDAEPLPDDGDGPPYQEESHRGAPRPFDVPPIPLPVLYRFVLAQGGGAFVGDTEDGVSGLPGRRIYQDGQLDVWMKEENGRVIVGVYGEHALDPRAALTVSVHETGRQIPVSVIAREPKKHQLDIGAVNDLSGKRLSLAFGTAADLTVLGTVDFVREP